MEIPFIIAICVLGAAFLFLAFKHVRDHERSDRSIYKDLVNVKRNKKEKKTK